MENFDPGSAANAEFKSSAEDNDKDEKKDSKKSSSSSFAAASPKETFDAKAIWQDAKDDDAKVEAPSILGGLISREETTEAEVEVAEDTPDAHADVVEDTTETITSDEVLSDEEFRYAAETIIQDRQSDVTAELSEAEANSPEEVEAAASSALYDAVQEHLDAGDDAEQAIQAAADETLAEIDEMAAETAADVTEDLELPAIETEDDEDDPTVITPTPTTTTHAATPMPPIPPIPQVVTPPGPAGPHEPQNPNGPNGPANPNGPNTAGANPNAVPHSPNVMPVPVPIERRRNRAGDMLLGGIVGYLIGRRRGRRKAEKELVPIQEKLEKQVKDLQKSIDEKETQVREAAREKLVPKVVTAEQKSPTKAEADPVLAASKQVENARQESLATDQQRQATTENPSESAEFKPVITPKERLTADEKMVDWKTATFNEVLVAAASIEVHDRNTRRSVREMFERGLITKEEVRRLVVENARGATTEQLRPRLKEIEAQELDPELRQARDFESSEKDRVAQAQDALAHAALPVAQPQPFGDALADTTSATSSTQDQTLDATANHVPPKAPEKNLAKTAVISGVAVGLFIALSLLLWLN